MLKIPKPIEVVFKRLMLLVGIYTLCRLLFYLFNYDYFQNATFGDTLLLFLFGLRFDLCAIVLTNAVFIGLHILPFSFFYHRIYQLLIKILFYLINFLALAFNGVDFIYFRFTNKRTTADFFQLFSLGEDMGNTIPRIIADFWYILGIVILIFIVMAWLYKKTDPGKPVKNTSMLLSWIYLFPVTGLAVLASRGGIQYVPISILSASYYTTPQFTPLILNTPFTILKTWGKSELVLKKYMNETELEKNFSLKRMYGQNKPFKPYNVVIIIMESFSKEYIGGLNAYKGYTPFLDSLIKESLVLTNAFANGKKSMEGIPAILASMPQLMSNPYITSAYNGDELVSISYLLKKKNYTSWFFHGGINGTMGFDRFTKMSGFDHYIGLNEYPYRNDFDGNWGIFDEPFFRFFTKTLDTSPKPFLASFFSISSHHPYSIPDSLKNSFSKGSLPIHESIMYADHSLKSFFEKARQSPWFENTLFVVTADHTGPSELPFYQTKAGMYAIPILFYMPGKITPSTSDITCQQADILPSILDYLGYDLPFQSFGNSIFDTTAKHMAFNYINSVYQLFEDNYVLQYDGSQATGLYNYTEDSLLSKNLIGEKNAIKSTHTKQLEAIIQQYNERLINNRLAK